MLEVIIVTLSVSQYKLSQAVSIIDPLLTFLRLGQNSSPVSDQCFDRFRFGCWTSKNISTVPSTATGFFMI